MTAEDLLQALNKTCSPGTGGSLDVAAVFGADLVGFLTTLAMPTRLDVTGGSGWQLDGAAGTVTLQATLATPILGLTPQNTLIRFAPSTVYADGFALLVDLPLEEGWRLSTSFPGLRGSLPDQLRTAASPPSSLVIAADAMTDPRSNQGQPAVAVPKGVTLLAQFDSSASAFAQIVSVLDGDPGLLPASGTLSYAKPDGPVTMALAVDGAQWTIGDLFGSGDGITMALSLVSARDPILKAYQSGIQLTATLDATPAGSATPQPGALAFTALVATGAAGIVTLKLANLPQPLPEPATLARFFGGGEFLKNLPNTYSSGTGIEVIALGLGIGLGTKTIEYATLGLGTTDGWRWSLWDGVITVSDLAFSAVVMSPLSSASRKAMLSFRGQVSIGGLPLTIGGTLPEAVVTGRLARPTPIDTGALLSNLKGPSVPTLPALTIDELDFEADLSAKQYSFDIDVAGSWTIGLGEDRTLTITDLAFAIGYRGGPDSSLTLAISGSMALGAATFDVSFDSTAGASRLSARWTTSGTPITYIDIAIALGLYGLPTLPTDLQFGLTAASLTLDLTTLSMVFELTTQTGSKGILVAGKTAAGGWGFIVGALVEAGLSIDLGKIPLLGDLVPSDDDVLGIAALRLVGGTTALPGYDPAVVTPFTGGTVASGLALSADVQIGSGVSKTLSVQFGGYDDHSALDAPPTSMAPAPARAPAPSSTAAPAQAPPPSAGDAPSSASPSPSVSWQEVQRKFGPLQINRVGFSLQGGRAASLLVDSTVTIGGMELSLQGLEATIPLSAPHTPTFALQGLGVGFTAADVAVSGALARTGDTTYGGELSVTAGAFGLTAMGCYMADAPPSFFAFIFLNDPLGGPPLFFVEGLAGGGGYNTTMALPDIDGVAGNPLVQAALGQLTEDQAEAQLKTLITSAPNETWGALGLRFSSFKLVESFALFTASFGAQVEFALLGLSTLTMPPPSPHDPSPVTPIAQAQMAVLATLEPQSGQLAVNAKLTPASYIFNTAAQLTGGFAFYLWFGESPHAGDFVVTLGGYNPHYTPPAWYPQVPALGLNWTVSAGMTVKGGLYFALTPSLIMAGGQLQAVWQSDGLTASFDWQADFLVRFKPFQYALDVMVSIGVTYRLDLGITSITISVHLGVDLSLWGPDFTGQAVVDLSVVTITISFGAGADPNADEAIGWSQFRTSFLPPANAAERTGTTTLAADGGATPTDSLIAASVPSGIIAQGEDGSWVVPPTANFVIRTQAPSKTLTVDGETPPLGRINTDFGIGPMNIAPGDLCVTLTVTTTADDTSGVPAWTVAASTGGVPAGLWLHTSASLQAPAMVDGALTGLTLTPKAQAALNPPLSVDARQLAASGDAPVVKPAWSSATAPSGDSFDQQAAMATLQSSAADAAVTSTRTAILASLRGLGLAIAPTVDLTGFAAVAAHALDAPPLLRRLGETQ